MRINTSDEIKGKRVLIIDDSDDMLSLLKHVLEGRGFGIDCRNNGEAALTQLKSGQPLPDVILLDLQMPVMDGYDFLKLKRQFPELSSIPTIVMSGVENCGPWADESVANSVLKKPLSISSVLDALKPYMPIH
jgi:CheY-like chemotaxis protein